jgi:FKBP-type peptidyl-prolyl cis-trans isomerase
MTTARTQVSLRWLACAVALAGCAKLTAPPTPEPLSTDTAAPAPKAAARGSASAAPAAAASAAPSAPEGDLKIEDLVVGKGKEAKSGDNVSVHYVGTLTNGTEFDASKKHGKPFDFQLGQGRVIRGWDKGVVGMKVGGKRKLTIPSSLAYGDRGSPPVIPPKSTLIFEIELLEIK